MQACMPPGQLIEDADLRCRQPWEGPWAEALCVASAAVVLCVNHARAARIPQQRSTPYVPCLCASYACRQRGLLQGRRTYVGAESVHKACLDMHAAYMDLNYTVNSFAEEGGRSVLFWTASGVNRVGLFGRPATFHRSTFSGVGGRAARLRARPWPAHLLRSGTCQPLHSASPCGGIASCKG